jgi:predicted DNA-binding transcriptional regulator AlpA
MGDPLLVAEFEMRILQDSKVGGLLQLGLPSTYRLPARNARPQYVTFGELSASRQLRPISFRWLSMRFHPSPKAIGMKSRCSRMEFRGLTSFACEKMRSQS